MVCPDDGLSRVFARVCYPEYFAKDDARTYGIRTVLLRIISFSHHDHVNSWSSRSTTQLDTRTKDRTTRATVTLTAGPFVYVLRPTPATPVKCAEATSTACATEPPRVLRLRLRQPVDGFFPQV